MAIPLGNRETSSESGRNESRVVETWNRRSRIFRNTDSGDEESM